MKVLFDEDTPRPFRRHLPGHEIRTVPEMGWAGVKNGALLDLAERAGFGALLTCDQNLPHQQNLLGRTLAVVVLVVPNKRMDTLVPLAPAVLEGLEGVQPGQLYEVRAARTPDLTPVWEADRGQDREV